MRSWIRSHHCATGWALIALVLLMGVPVALADAPSEELFVKAQDIDPKVLRDTVGVLSLRISLAVPQTERVTRYDLRAETFAADGALVLKETTVISGVRWDDMRVYRFPIVKVQGDYRQIVTDPLRDLRTWIKISEISELYASLGEESYCDVHEVLFTEERLSGRVDIFFGEQKKPRKLYLEPEESSTFTLVSPSPGTARNSDNRKGLFISQVEGGLAELWSDEGDDHAPRRLGWITVEDELSDLSQPKPRKLYQSPQESSSFTLTPAEPIVVRSSGTGQDTSGTDALFFHQARNGFAEVCADGDSGSAPRCPGWIKIIEGSYGGLGDYYPRGSGLTVVDLAFLEDPAEPQELYETPDDNASFRPLLLNGLPVSRRMSVARIKNGFALLVDYEYCFTDRLRPVGWIKIRSQDGKLMIWPATPDQCT